MKKSLLLVPLVLATMLLRAQENNFLLYSLKGNVSVVENKVETKAKIGRMLNATSVLKIANGGTATLICNEAAMFSLKPGTYTMSMFGDSCKVQNSSVAANYVRYVWAQLTRSGSAGSDRRKYMNTVGAVSRSVNNIWIDPRLDTVNYSGGEFPLSWKSYADAKDFDFTLYAGEATGAPTYKTTVGKLKIQLASFKDKLKPGTSYTWTASVKGEQNDEFKVLNYVSKATYEAVLADIKTSIGAFENAAEEAYRTAFMLEDAHYLADAYQYYLKATQLAPDVPLYRSTLMSFKKDYEIK